MATALFRELPTTQAPDRKYHILSLGPDGAVYSFGGLSSGGRGDERQSRPAGAVLRMHPSTGEWTVLSPEGVSRGSLCQSFTHTVLKRPHGAGAPGAPSPRNEACGSIVGDAFWVFGGSLEAEGGGQGQSCDELWCFDLCGCEWERVSAPHGPSPRCASGYAVSGARLFIYGGGGVGPDQQITPPLDDVFVFDTARRTWRELSSRSPAPPGRSLPQIAVPGDGEELYVFGGFSAQGHRLNDTWVLTGLRAESCGEHAGDSERGSEPNWSELPLSRESRPAPRSCHAGAVVQLPGSPGHHWLIVGGRLGFGAAAFKDGVADTTDAEDVWLLDFADPAAGWSEAEVRGVRPGPLRSHAMVAVGAPMSAAGTEPANPAVVLIHGGRSEQQPVMHGTYELSVSATHGRSAVCL